MALHFKLSFLMLMINVFLIIFFPAQSGTSSTDTVDNFLTYNESSQTIIPNDQFEDGITDGLTSTTGTSSFFDSMFAVLDALGLLVSVLFGLPIFIYTTPLIGFESKFLLAVPTIFAYIYSTISFIRRGE